MPDKPHHPDISEPAKTQKGVSRRKFLRGVGAGVVGTAASAPLLAPVAARITNDAGTTEQPFREGHPTGGRSVGPDAIPMTLNVNGKDYSIEVEPRTTLANALRYNLGLTGTKVVCDRGECGACTVIADGRTVYSCMTLAADAQGKKIRTVEGLAQNSKATPIQEAFVQTDGMMCGFCTPGFIVSSTALLERNPHPTEAEVRDALRGNLCRCGTYPRVFEACLTAMGAGKGGRHA